MTLPPTRDVPRIDLTAARRTVLVRRPLHWELAAELIAALEAAWAELDARGGHDGIAAAPRPFAAPCVGSPERRASSSSSPAAD